jgi:Predicted membrane protein (DUF2306)
LIASNAEVLRSSALHPGERAARRKPLAASAALPDHATRIDNLFRGEQTEMTSNSHAVAAGLHAAAVSRQPETRRRPIGHKALTAASRLWFVVAVAGQWFFAFYVAWFYGGAAARGDWQAWNQALPRGLMAGDSVGNATLASHLLLAAIITFIGPLQLIPQVRAHLPRLHRWTGRVYLLTAVVMGAGGLYMLLTRGTVGDGSQHLAIGLNALAIMLCATLAWRSAVKRRFDVHRRWALRLFLVVNGVWFFRVGLMLWLVINQRAVGFDPKTFEGPFLTFLAFAQFLLPLAALELYLRARDRGTSRQRLAMATGLLLLTAAMGVGIFGAVMGMWLPRMH